MCASYLYMRIFAANCARNTWTRVFQVVAKEPIGNFDRQSAAGCHPALRRLVKFEKSPFQGRSLRSADSMVLTMSMAMVRGPTPPGTGVYAEALAAASIGWTSPTNTLPLRSN